MVQTMKTGSTLTCLWPASLDHAVMPVMMPRYSDSDMCRDGYAAARGLLRTPSMSTEECTAYQASNRNALGRLSCSW